MNDEESLEKYLFSFVNITIMMYKVEKILFVYFALHMEEKGVPRIPTKIFGFVIFFVK